MHQRRLLRRSYLLALLLLLSFSLTYTIPRFRHYHRPYHYHTSHQSKYLSEEDFNPSYYAYDNPDLINRYESVEVWRSPDSFTPTHPSYPNSRPKVPHWSKFTTKGEYLKQPLSADYAKGSEKVFLMIKTGADVIWNRLPIHLVTTLTRVPNFALYADKPGSVGGYEVIDILSNVTDETFQSDAFDKYRRMKLLHNQHNIYDSAEVELDGGWDLDKFKNIPMLAHAYSVSPKSDWFIFMDADSYIMMDVMTKWLRKLNPNEILYMGARTLYKDLQFAHGGSVVVLSRKALEETVGKHPEYVQEYEKKAFDYCCGDVLVAAMLREKTGHLVRHGAEYPYVDYRFQGSSFHDFSIKEHIWCRQIQTFHHLTTHDVEILYEYEKLRGPNRDDLTYYDLYRDFYLPYIDERMEHWNNLASDVVWTEQTPPMLEQIEGNLIPYESFESCKEACEVVDWCLSFRYMADKKYCGLGSSIRLGKPILLDFPSKSRDKYINTMMDREEYHDITSGFMIKRIRAFRRNQVCDLLYRSDEVDVKPDGGKGDEYEGWALRRTKKVAEKIQKEREGNMEQKKKEKEEKLKEEKLKEEKLKEEKLKEEKLKEEKLKEEKLKEEKLKEEKLKDEKLKDEKLKEEKLKEEKVKEEKVKEDNKKEDSKSKGGKKKEDEPKKDMKKDKKIDKEVKGDKQEEEEEQKNSSDDLPKNNKKAAVAVVTVTYFVNKEARSTRSLDSM